MTTLQALVWAISVGFLLYSVVINSSFLVLTGLALADLLVYRRRIDFAGFDDWFLDPHTRGVSVLMPAYNESATIVQSVQAMTALRYPDFEVVVIDDGSKDDTVAKMIAEFDMVAVPLVPGGQIATKGEVTGTWVSRKGAHNLALVTKANGGKADALNAGINHARKELVCMVDADSLLDPRALLDVARPFADDPGRVVATGGVVRVANGSRVERGRVAELRMPSGWLARIQVAEYLRAFLIGRAGWSRLGGLLIISGAFGLFRKDVLLEVDGLSTDCIGEDAELVVRIHRMVGDQRRDAQVVFVPEPVAWTEVPEDRNVLRKQRRRWHRGLAEIFVRHRGMLLRPRYGVIGMVTMPWFLFFELLAPVAEVAGLALPGLPDRGPSRRAHRRPDLGRGERRGGGPPARRVDPLRHLRHARRAAGGGDLLPPLPRGPRPAARGGGRGRGELRLPAAERVVAPGRHHRGAAPVEARLGRHAAQGVRHEAPGAP